MSVKGIIQSRVPVRRLSRRKFVERRPRPDRTRRDSQRFAGFQRAQQRVSELDTRREDS